MGDIPEPRWRDSDLEWKRNIWFFMDLGAREFWNQYMRDNPIPGQARAVATAVFYTAASYNTAYVAPLPIQIYTWAQTFDCDWLTVDLAVRAVEEHFAESEDGRLLPSHVLRKAAVLKLTEGV